MGPLLIGTRSKTDHLSFVDPHSPQLAEAILTEPAAHTIDDSGSIRLADTRTRVSGENERDRFLPGDDSENEDEEALQEERRRVLSNSGAQLSRINLQATGGEDDDYELVQRPGHERSDEGRGPSGSLSAKAGAILVITSSMAIFPAFISLSHIQFLAHSGNSQYLHRHSSIPRHRLSGYSICHV